MGIRIPNLFLIVFVCACLLGFIIAVVIPDKRPTKPKSSKPAAGVEYRRINSRGITAHAAKIDLRRARARVLLPSRGRVRESLSDLVAREPQAVVGINAPYFTPAGEVMGLLVKDGVRIKTIPESRFKIDLTQIGFRTATASITNSDSIEGYLELVSGGPCLIRDRRMLDFEGHNEFMKERDARTAVGLVDPCTIICLVAENATGRELAEILLSLGVTDAINLDGGASSSMIVRNGDGMEIVNGGSQPVAAGLAFCER